MSAIEGEGVRYRGGGCPLEVSAIEGGGVSAIEGRGVRYRGEGCPL